MSLGACYRTPGHKQRQLSGCPVDVVLYAHNIVGEVEVIEGKELLSESSRRFAKKEGFPSRLEDQDLHRFGNPLLAAWGKQGRDYVKLLDEWDDLATSQRIFKSDINLFSEDLPETPTLLQSIQNGISELRPLPSDDEETTPIRGDDDSITFHVAHSPQREIEMVAEKYEAEWAKLMPLTHAAFVANGRVAP